MPDFRTRLAALGLSQVELRRFIRDLSGHDLDPTTTSRWARGVRPPSAEINALLTLIEDPKPLQHLRQQLAKKQPGRSERHDRA